MYNISGSCVREGTHTPIFLGKEVFPMTEEKLLAELRALLLEVLPDADVSKMTADSDFKKDLELDSLNMVMLAVAIENRYGFRFDAAPRMDTVADLIAYVMPRIATAQGSDGKAKEERKTTFVTTDAAAADTPKVTADGMSAHPDIPDDESPAVRLVRSAKIIHIVVSALLLLSGVFISIWGEYPVLVKWVAGAVFILMGGASMLGYFCNDLYRLAFNHDLAIGAFSIIFGGMCWLLPNEVMLLTYAVCIYVILDGFTKLQTAIEAKDFGMERWRVMLLTAIVVVGMGLVAFIILICNQRADLLMGLALAVDGAENIWNTVYTVKVKAAIPHR